MYPEEKARAWLHWQELRADCVGTLHRGCVWEAWGLGLCLRLRKKKGAALIAHAPITSHTYGRCLKWNFYLKLLSIGITIILLSETWTKLFNFSCSGSANVALFDVRHNIFRLRNWNGTSAPTVRIDWVNDMLIKVLTFGVGTGITLVCAAVFVFFDATAADSSRGFRKSVNNFSL